MIPILYDKDETAFISNGLGRLRDCISCVVTEERNGVYECDFEYPVSADDFNDIQIGRIIGVTHDDSDDIQPFDIVSYSKPINGIVTFHCAHISYRQTYLTVTGSNINSLADAFTLFADAEPSNPFTYQTDKTSEGYLSSADGIPKSVRSMLGGIEGSILDIYGGEYEWDKFNVILHSARGVDRDFSIRYGVNMLDYTEELDSQGTYMSCVPYWTDGTITIVGDRQVSTGSTVTGRGECVPLDVSDKFESQPTKAQVEAMGLSVMNAKNPSLPTQNIHVEFVRMQDLGFENFNALLQCNLCDTIKVVFPFYNTSERFKIVKTVWDVLQDRYESMELGDLSVTLAEALGIEQGSERKAEEVDYITVKGTSGNWYYEKYASGKVEAWGYETIAFSSYTAIGSSTAGFYRSPNNSVTIPSGIFPDTPTHVEAFVHSASTVWVGFVGIPQSATSIGVQAIRGNNSSASAAVHIHAVYYPSDY